MTFPDLNFTLTPDMMFTSTTTARWDVIQDGRLTALSSDSAAKTGGIDFDSGTTVQNVSITINNDNLRGQDGSFSPRVTEAATDGAETPISPDHAITLIEDGKGLSFKSFILPTATQHETLVLASSHSVTGDPGDDVIIITKDQNLDLMIDAGSDVNVIKFDEDVSITHVFVDVIRIDDLPYAVDYIMLTLGTGAEIAVTAPAQTEGGALQFQFGDGALMDYAGLVASATAGGFKNDADGNATDELNTPIETTALASAPNSGNTSPQLTVPDLADTIPDTVTDGSIFTLTPPSALTSATDVQWDIIPDARYIAAVNSDFAVRTDQINFLINDNVRGQDRSFNLHLNVNEAPSLNAVTAVGSVAENAVASAISDISFTPSDPEGSATFTADSFTLTSGDGFDNDDLNALFEVVAGSGGVFGLQLKSEQQLNFEGKSSYAINVTVSDGSVSSTATSLTVNVTNVDDVAPDITSGSTGKMALPENDQVLASAVVYEARGTADVGAITWSLEGANAALFVINGSTGDVRFTADTTPNYETDPSYSFTVVATSPTGLTSRQAVSIEVTDVDDVAPDIRSGGTGDALTENDLVSASAVVYEARGTADVGAITWSLGGADATLFRIDGSTGDVRFRDATTPNHEAKASYSFTVVATSPNRLTSQQGVTIQVTDVNEAPVLNAVTGATITDNATSDSGSTVAGSLTGSLSGTDVDAGDTAGLTFAANNAVDDTSKSGYDHRVDGTYGKLYYNEGSGAYIFERDEAAINALNATQNVNDTFTVSVSDQGGLTSASRALVFTVNGANDAPVLNAVTGATITDNANSDSGSTVAGSLTGTLAGTDVDAGDTLVFAANNAVGDTSKSDYDHRVSGTYGKLYYNEGSGAYIFERDEAAINALGATQNVNDTFTVSVSDQGGLTSASRALVFTVNGANDAPILNAVTGATITDNAASDTGSTVAGSLTGTLSGTDVDAGDTLTFAASNATGDTSKGGYDHRVDGTYGNLYYNEGSGAYIFERDEAAINALNATQNVNDTFTVSVSDGNLTSASRALVFTVNGANDAPVLNAVTGATITDNASSDAGSTVAGSLTGTLVGTDVDTGDAASLTFAASNAVGDTSKGGYDHRVDGTYGNLYYNEGSGAYIFERDEAAINALGATQNVNDTFTVSVSDGSLTSATRALVFTVVGASDAPVLNAVTGATITDNAASDTGSTVAGSLTGTLAGTDVDTGDAAGLTFAASGATDNTSKSGYDHRVDGTYGKLYYNEGTGAYIFERDEAAINAVGDGSTVNDTFTVSAVDPDSVSSATRALVFTVNGANDAPVLNAVTGATITDNATPSSTVTTGSLTGTLAGTDADTGDTLTFAVSNATDDTSKGGYDHRVDGTYGKLYYNEGSGAYEFERDEAAINALNATQNVNDTFTVSVSDQGGLTSASRALAFTVDGANDAPVLNAVTGATITDNAASDTGSTVAGSLTGTLAGTDADTGDTASLTFAASGATGDTSKGGYDHRVDGTYGKLFYNESSGAYIFERDEAAINAVGATQNVNDTFTVSATDQHGVSSATRALVFTVNGANDAPVLNAVTGATITDNATPSSTVTLGSLTGTLAGTDVDTGDAAGLTFAASNATGDTSKNGYDHRVDGTYGDLYYNESSGAYIFERDEAAINALNAGQNVNDTFTVSVSDQGGASSASRALVFSVVGANDTPVLNAVTGATITDNAASDSGSTVAGSLTGTLAGTDADTGDAAGLTFAANNAVDDTSKSGYDHRVDGTYGTFYYNEGSGAYIFERDEAAINALDAAQNVNDSFTVSVSDGSLTSASRALVFTVDGANDAPVLNAVTGATITDNAASDTGSTVAGSLTGTLAGTDVDTGDAASLTFAANGATGDTSKGGYTHSAGGSYGKLYYNEGSGAYIFERDEAAINALDAGQNVNDTFTVSVSDGNLTSATRALVFNVNGANDAPVLNAVTGATITDNANSDTGSTVAGSLTGTLAGTDVDTGDAAALTFAASNATGDTSKGGYTHSVDGTYGKFYYNEGSGAYIFERDEAAINALASGDTGDDTFTVSVSDGNLTSASRALVFTVEGVDEANIAPVLNAVTGATITDNATPSSTVTLGSLTGTLVGTDADTGDTLVFAANNATGDTSKGGYDHSVGGTYGKLYYNEGSGAYIFERDEAAINALDATQNVNDTFTVSVVDQRGASSATRALVFTVNGANDAPVLNAVTGATITDNAASDTGSTVAGSLTGTLAGTDADTGDAASLVFAASNATDNTSKGGYDHRVDGSYGKLYYNEGSGAYIFERDEAAINALNAGQNVNDTFTVSVSDGNLTSATRALVFNVNGANDAPVRSVNTATTLDEGGMVALAEANLRFTDVDNTRAQVVYVITEAPGHGELRLSGTALTANDTFTDDDINNDLVTYHHDGSENHTDSFKFRVENQDGSGTALTTASGGVANVFTHSFTITAVNDAPSFEPATDYTKDYTAASSPTVGDLVITMSELDEGGTAIVNVDDIGAFDPDNNEGDITITFTQILLNGGLATNTVKLQRNSDPSDSAGWVDIAANDTIGLTAIKAGNVRVIHNGDEPSVSDAFTFKIRAGDAADQSAEVDVTVAVNPINEAPTATPGSGITVGDRANHTFTADDFGFADPDGDDLTSIEILTLPALGSLRFSDNLTVAITAPRVVSSADIAKLTYVPVNVNTDTSTSFTYRVTANSQSSDVATLNITVTENNIPTLSSVTAVGDVAENAVAANISDITFTPNDADPSQTAFAASDFTLESNEDHSGLTSSEVTALNTQLNNLFEVVAGSAGAFGVKLKTGQSLNYETKNQYLIKVTVTDDDSAEAAEDLTINVNNVDERPNVGNIAPTTITDNPDSDADNIVTAGSLTGVVPVNDAHLVRSFHFSGGTYFAGGRDGTYGALHTDRNNGNYTYRLKEELFNALDAGETGNDTFSVVISAQGSFSGSHHFVFNIVGSNDAPKLTGGGTVRTNEDSTATQELTLTFSDPDGGDTNASIILRGVAASGTPAYDAAYASITDGATIAGTYGSFTFARNDGTGQLTATYDLDEANATVQGLNNTSALVDKLTVFAHDDSGKASIAPQSFVIIIIGANDAPTATPGSDIRTGDLTPYTFTADDFGFADPDGDALTSIQILTLPALGSLMLNTGTVNVPVNVPVTAGQTVLASAIGSLTYVPVDGAADTTASFTYNVGSNSLRSDTATLNIAVINERSPMIDSGSTGDALTENAEVADGAAVYTATGFAVTWSLKDGTGDVDLFEIDAASGAVTFRDADTATPNYDPTTPNYEVKPSYSFTIVARSGALTTEQAVTIQVTDVNDAPVLNAVTGATITENATPSSTVAPGSLSGRVVGADEDAGDTWTYAAERVGVTTETDTTVSLGGGINSTHRVDGAYGKFYYNDANGGYVFVRNEAAINAVAGDTVNDTFAVSATDQHGLASEPRDLVFTVVGSNDAPVQAANTVTTLDEGGMVTLAEANLNFTDVDNIRAEVVYVITEAPGHGELRLSGTALTANDTFTDAQINSGAVTYHHDGSENHSDDFKFRVENQDTDGTALITASGGVANVFTHNFTITAVNDAPSFEPATDYTKDYTAASSPTVGDLVITMSELDEGGTAIVNVDDIGAFDPDNNDGEVTITFTQIVLNGGLATDTVKLQRNSDPSDSAGWVDIDNANNTISLTAIKAGNVRVIHNGDEPSTSDAFTFKIRAEDATAQSAEVDVSVAVNPINEAPTATPGSGITTGDRTNHTFKVADFGFADPDGDDLTSIEIRTLPALGSLRFSDDLTVAITAPRVVSSADIAKLTYVPVIGNTDTTTSFTYRVTANSQSSDVATLNIAVTDNNIPTLSSVTAVGDVAENAVAANISDITFTPNDADPSQTAFAASDFTLESNEDHSGLTSSEVTALNNRVNTLFEVVAGSAGAFGVKLKTGQSLDFETKNQYLIKVTVTDDDSAEAAEDLTINVNNVDERPNVGTIAPTTITDNPDSDADNIVTAGSLTGVVPVNDAHLVRSFHFSGGTYFAGGRDGTYGALHTDRNNGNYTYRLKEELFNALDAGETGSDTFSVVISAQGSFSGTHNFVFNIVGSNDAPKLTGGGTATIGEDSTAITSPATFTFSDPDGDDTNATIILRGTTAGGTPAYDAAYASITDGATIAGSYGSFIFARNDGTGTGTGQVTATYDLDETNATVQWLNNGRALVEKLTVFAHDDGDKVSITPQTFVITINGANDAPVLNAVTGATITDNAASATGSTFTGRLDGTLVGTDVDVDAAALTFAASNAVGDTSKSGYDHRASGTYGKLYYNEGSGAYIFERDEAAINALDATQNVNDTFTVSATDQHGAESASRALVFTVVGANEATANNIPVLNAVTGATITDNATLSSTITTGSLMGTLAGTDADGDTLTYIVSGSSTVQGKTGYTHSITGIYGTFYHNSGSGAYIFERDEAAINALDGTQNVNDTFTVSATDQHGASSATQNLVFTVEGVDEAPVLNAIAPVTITDNATPTSTFTGSLTGTLAGTDADAGDTAALTYAAERAGVTTETDTTVSLGGGINSTHRVDGAYGKFYYNEDNGKYIFERDEAAINALDATQNVNDTFVAHTVDPDGLMSEAKNLVFNVVGANDIPTAAPRSGITTGDRTNYTFTVGDFGFADGEGDDLTSIEILTLPALGSLRFSDDLTVAITAPRVVSSADIAKLTYVPVDGSTDDATASFTYRVTANSQSSDVATLNIALNNQIASNNAPSLGSVTAAGSVAENAVAANISDITFTPNDADPSQTAFAASDFTLESNEDHSGLTSSEVDALNTQVNTLFEVVAGSAGAFGVKLKTGQSLDFETKNQYLIKVTVTDAAFEEAAVNLTINVNDVIERGSIAAIAPTTITDNPDSDADSIVTAGSLTGTARGSNTLYIFSGGSYINATYGFLHSNIRTGGNYRYQLKEEVINALDAGETGRDSFYVGIVGSRTGGQSFVFNIIGVSDAPKLTGGGTVSTNEDSTDTHEATFTFSDSDAADTNASIILRGVVAGGTPDYSDAYASITNGATIAGSYGSFTFTRNDGTGTGNGQVTATYDFDETSATVQGLNNGSVFIEKLTIFAHDDSGKASIAPQSFVITINGVDDAPTATPGSGLRITDRTPYTFTADDFGFADPDVNDELSSIQILTLPALGSLMLNGGAVTAGDTISAGDITGLTYVPINGAADATASFTYNVGSNSLRSAEATLNIAVINERPPMIDSGSTGDALTEEVEVADGAAVYTATGVAIAWSLKDGTGDVDLFEIDAVSGAVTFRDADTATPDYDPTTPDFEVKSSYSFRVVATSDSLTAEQLVTIQVTDVNDAPVLNAVTGATITDNATPSSTVAPGSLTGRLVGADEDAGDTWTYAAERAGVTTETDTTVSLGGGINSTHRVDGAYGKFYYNSSNGMYIFVRDEAAINAVANGITVNDTFAVSATDQGGLTSASRALVFTVVGSNDAPVQAANTATTLDEGGMVTLAEANLNFTDVDNTRAQVVYVITEAPGHGELRLSGTALTANDTFTDDDINNDLVTYHHDGSENHTDSFKFRVENQDGSGTALTTASGGVSGVFTHSFTITAVNDAPSFEPATDYTKDYTAASSPTVGDLVITMSELDEGGTAIVNVDDIGAFDPDNNDGEVTITFTQIVLNGGLATNTVKLQRNSDPSDGAGWVDIDNANNTISLTAIKAGNVRVIHNGDEPSASDAFTFKIRAGDATAQSAEVDVSVAVNPINEAPTATPGSGITVGDRTNYPFTADDFGFADPDGDALTSITIITAPTLGRLTLNGSAVTAGGVVTLADITSLIYEPVDGAAGATANFTYRVTANSQSSDVATLNIALNNQIAGNTAPSLGSVTAAGSVAENAVAANISDITFTPNDAETSSFAASDFTLASNEDHSGLTPSEVTALNTQVNTLFEVVAGSAGAFGVKLKTGQSLDFETKNQYLIKVTVTDAAFEEAAVNLTINVNDVNERGSIAAIAPTTITDNPYSDADSTVTAGSLTGSASGGNTLYIFSGGSYIDATYGFLHSDLRTGNYTYQLKEEVINALDAGDTGRDSFYVGIAGSRTGGQSFVFNIIGVSDAPKLTGGGTVSTNEDSTDTHETTFTFSDSDAADTNASITLRGTAAGGGPGYSDAHTSITNGATITIAGAYGSFTLARNDEAGQVTATYDFDETNATVQGLSDVRALVEQLTVFAHDDSGKASVAPQTFVITIFGVNDAPVLDPVTAEGDVAENVRGAAISDIKFTPSDAETSSFTATDFTLESNEDHSGLTSSEVTALNNRVNTLFEVVAGSEEGVFGVKLKEGQELSYEDKSSYEITVTVTDDTGLTDAADLTVNVTDVI